MVARSLPATWTVPWRKVALVVWLSVNGVLIVWLVGAMFVTWGHPADWGHWVRAASHLSGGMYDDGVFVWSPLAAWLFAYIIIPLGWPVLVAAHFAVLPLLGKRIALIAVTAAPFWLDAIGGNFFTFVVVAAFLAVRGSRPAALVYFALCLLMPRPVQIPLALWLLARDRSLIVPVIGMTVVSTALVLLSGYAAEWIAALLDLGGGWPFASWDVGPTRFLGSAWLIVGIPLAAWLLWKGRPGWAGLAMSPYLAPQYLLLPFAERHEPD